MTPIASVILAATLVLGAQTAAPTVNAPAEAGHPHVLHTPTDAEIADFTAKRAAFVDFKQRLFTLIATYDRRKTTQVDIEAIMGVSFVSDPTAETFGVPASPDKKSATSFKGVKIEQHIQPGARLFDHEDATPASVPGAISYGLQIDAYEDADTCLTLAELRAHFTPAKGWHYVQASMFYPGIGGTRDGATAFGFIDGETLKMSADDETTLGDLNARLADDRDPAKQTQDIGQLDAVKARIDGCVYLFALR